MDLIQKKKKKTLLLCKRSCDDDEKISHRLGENICKPHRRIKNSKNATVKKKKKQAKNLVPKWAKEHGHLVKMVV